MPFQPLSCSSVRARCWRSHSSRTALRVRPSRDAKLPNRSPLFASVIRTIISSRFHARGRGRLICDSMRPARTGSSPALKAA
jgi:hypothetical protein